MLITRPLTKVLPIAAASGYFQLEMEKSEVTIRAATNDDIPRVTALISSVLSEFGLQFEPHSTDSDLADIEKSYFSRGGCFEVVENSAGDLIGTVGFAVVDRETCELRKMYLVPEARGIGLGRHLLERSIQRGKRSGYKRMILDTQSSLKQAIKLYTGFGFKPIEIDHSSSRADCAYALEL